MEKLTRREEELMRCFWERGPLFVRELVAMMPDPKPHFNTLSTMVRALEAKGYVGHEAFGTERALVLGVDLHEGAGDGETESLGLAFVAAAVEVNGDIVLLYAVKSLEGLEHDVLENRRGEVLVECAAVVVAGDRDHAVTFLQDNAGHGGLTAANCIYIFHN